MKHLFALALCMFLFLAGRARAGDGDQIAQEKLTGTWWGEMTVTDESFMKAIGSRICWLVERKADGTCRMKCFRVDDAKKIYYLTESRTGKWQLNGSGLRQSWTNGTSSEDEVRWEKGKLHWKREFSTPSSFMGCDIFELHDEVATKEYQPPLPADYRRVTQKEALDSPNSPDPPGGES